MQVWCCLKSRMASGCTTGPKIPSLSTLRRWIRPERDLLEPRELCSSIKCFRISPSRSLTTNALCSTNSAVATWPYRNLSSQWIKATINPAEATLRTALLIPTPCASVSPKAGVQNILASSSLPVPAGLKSFWQHLLPHPDDINMFSAMSLSLSLSLLQEN